MRIVVMGTGYVGLVTGACLASAGHEVCCVDADQTKVDRLRVGELPIFERGLPPMVAASASKGRLTFTSSAEEALTQAEVVFCAVGTPPTSDGHADVDAVMSVVRETARCATRPTLLVLKSTVPVGTNLRATTLLRELGAMKVEVVSNPEFLKEGSAVDDFCRPDRVVLGVHSAAAATTMRRLYEPFTGGDVPVLVMDPSSAELVKYASNAMLATRVSFMNALTPLCERFGADIERVRDGVGADSRIGAAFLRAGLGYGGSCFPKDVKALVRTARDVGEPFELLVEVERINERQKKRLFEKLTSAFEPEGGLEGRCIALWGLAFKPDTDDLREAPAMELVRGLLTAGARVRAHDPAASEKAREALAPLMSTGNLEIVPTMYEATANADALAIATEWAQYASPDFERLRRQLTRPWIFDGRNVWSPDEVVRNGFVYRSIGRPDAVPGASR